MIHDWNPRLQTKLSLYRQLQSSLQVFLACPIPLQDSPVGEQIPQVLRMRDGCTSANSDISRSEIIHYRILLAYNCECQWSDANSFRIALVQTCNHHPWGVDLRQHNQTVCKSSISQSLPTSLIRRCRGENKQGISLPMGQKEQAQKSRKTASNQHLQSVRVRKWHDLIQGGQFRERRTWPPRATRKQREIGNSGRWSLWRAKWHMEQC